MHVAFGVSLEVGNEAIDGNDGRVDMGIKSFVVE